MGVLMPISLFVTKLTEAEKRHDGYIMGATGQDPKTWKTTSWWFTQYSGEQKKKALYWREHAAKVWDCNGLAEGLYKEYSGIDINSKARYNYAQWCEVKGTGSIPKKKRVPGAAVFIHSTSAGYITHVGYLEKPVTANDPTGDWYVIEARGVMYGVVRTKLSQRGWNRWGYMTKYFDYSNQNGVITPPRLVLGDRLLKHGCEGADVAELQTILIDIGLSCGSWGADGDFGDATEMAVRDFQRKNGLQVDGQFGKKSLAKLRELISKRDEDIPKQVLIVGGNCWVRSEPSTKGSQYGVVMESSKLQYANDISDDGWLKVVYNGQNGWVSGKYGRLV